MLLKTNSKKFIHLRNYTQYSLSKGALRISDIVDFCKENNSPASAITDFNNLFGCMQFSLTCKENGIQPIIGCNLFLVDENYESGYVLLLAKNKIGYVNLSKLVSSSYLDNSKDSNPHIKFDNLEYSSKGLICLAGGELGLVTKNFRENNPIKSNGIIQKLVKYFNDDFFIEIQRKNDENSRDLGYENYLLNLSIKQKIPIVATNENYFLDKKFYNSHDALLSISQQKYIDTEDRIKSNVDSYLKDPDEMCELFSDLPQACLNSLSIAKKCCFFLNEKEPSLPKLVTGRINENDMLREKSLDGLKKRFNQIRVCEDETIYIKRLNFELDIIVSMGYSSYFLIVADFISWAKKNQIPVGPGRGSGAGSLVAWSLSITNLDPIRFGLLFERFLNPERISLPDFDIDFCNERRDDVIRYVQRKYGKSNVAQIITFGSFQARAALRDVGRVLQLPLNQVDEICKMIPNNPAQPISLKEFVKNNDKIKKILRDDLNIKKLFKISIDLEGLLRHASTHAAGIVISDKPLAGIIPLYKEPKSDFPVTQFSMKYVEKIGLIKFDFLGLKT